MGSIGFQDIELVLVCHNEVKVSIVMNIFEIKPNEKGLKQLNSKIVVEKCVNDIMVCAVKKQLK